MDDSNYLPAVMKPSVHAVTFANKNEPGSKKPPKLYGTTRPGTTDYVSIDSNQLLWLLMWEPDGDMIYFGVEGSRVSRALGGLVPPGDGTNDHDNGVRVHITFHTYLPLSPESQIELRSRFSKTTAAYNESSPAYSLVSTKVACIHEPAVRSS